MNLYSKILKVWAILSGLIVVFTVAVLFIYIFINGSSAVNIDFLTKSPSGAKGGIFPAIVGTIYLGVISSLISCIFSIATAIYIRFLCKSKRIYKFIILTLQSIAGIPSIIIGLFGYTLFVMNMGFGRSLLSASLTLSIMTIPYITLRIEKSFREIQLDLINSSEMLGVSRIYTVTNLIIPMSYKDILSSVALSSGYAMGATAPIMFTGAVIYASSPNSIMDPIMALPYHLYILVNEGISIESAYGTALVLMIIIVLINLICYLEGNRKDL